MLLLRHYFHSARRLEAENADAVGGGQRVANPGAKVRDQSREGALIFNMRLGEFHFCLAKNGIPLRNSRESTRADGDGLAMNAGGDAAAGVQLDDRDLMRRFGQERLGRGRASAVFQIARHPTTIIVFRGRLKACPTMVPK